MNNIKKKLLKSGIILSTGAVIINGSSVHLLLGQNDNVVQAVTQDNGSVINITPGTVGDYFSTHGRGVTSGGSWQSTIDKNGLITLTEDKVWQVGNVTLNNKISLYQDFNLSGQVNLGDKNTAQGGADGIGFVFHPGSIEAVGNPGQWLGMGGLPNAFGFKLDTYYNGLKNDGGYRAEDGSGGSFDPAEILNPDGSNAVQDGNTRVSFGDFMSTDGSGRMTTSPTTGGSKAQVIPDPDGNNFLPFEIHYVAATHMLSVTYNGQTWMEDITSLMPPDGKVSFVIAGSTGGSKNQQQVKIDNFSYTEATGTITVKHQDTNGNPIIPNEQRTGELTSPYTTQPLPVDPSKYTLVTTPSNANGTYMPNNQEVVYVYQPVYEVTERKVITETVNYVDKDNNPLPGVSPGKRQVTFVSVMNKATETETYYYIEGDKPTPTIGANGEPEGNWGIGLTEFPEIPNPSVPNYHVINTDVPPRYTNSSKDFSKTTPQDVSFFDDDSQYNFTVTYDKDVSSYTLWAVDINGNSLMEPVITPGNVGDLYNTTPPPIAGYQLVTIPANANGTIDSTNQKVTYVYKVIYDTKLDVKAETIDYVDQNGSSIGVPSSVTQISFFTVRNPMTGESKTYYKNGGNQAPTIDDNGVPDSSWTEGSTSFPEVANPTPKNYYYIYSDDPDSNAEKVVAKPVNSGSADINIKVTYAHEKGSVTIHAVDTNGKALTITSSPIVQNGNVDDSYTTTAPAISNYKLVNPLPANQNGTYIKGDIPVTYVYAINYQVSTPKVVTENINYQDAAGNTMAPSVTNKVSFITVTDPVNGGQTIYYKTGEQTAKPEVDNNGVPDNSWTKGGTRFDAIAHPAVPDYHVVSTNDPDNDLTQTRVKPAAINTADMSYTVIYARDTGTVTVKAVDTAGKALLDKPLVTTGDTGSDYATTAPDIPNYRLVKSPANGSGKYSLGNQDVEYVYEVVYQISEVKTVSETIHYVDKNGKTVADDYKRSVSFVTVTNPATGGKTVYYKAGAENPKPEIDNKGNVLDSSWTKADQITFEAVKNPAVNGLHVISTTDKDSDLIQTVEKVLRADSKNLDITVVYGKDDEAIAPPTEPSQPSQPTQPSKPSTPAQSSRSTALPTPKTDNRVLPKTGESDQITLARSGIGAILLGISGFLLKKRKNSSHINEQEYH
jgi:LPXTG-motif cell wall-anchored protein